LNRNHALFVCSANLQRSPTAEKIFQDWKGKWETKSAGTTPYMFRQPITQNLIDWADVIIVMESHHADYIQSKFKVDQKKIKVLNIPDIYLRDDPELILELKKQVTPLLTSHI
jgi:predicted protein tyrosine phosphatase